MMFVYSVMNPNGTEAIGSQPNQKMLPASGKSHPIPIFSKHILDSTDALKPNINLENAQKVKYFNESPILIML